MNLIGLILIAALSGFIVAVSLRLQLRQSSVEAAEGERLHEPDARLHGSNKPVPRAEPEKLWSATPPLWLSNRQH